MGLKPAMAKPAATPAILASAMPQSMARSGCCCPYFSVPMQLIKSASR